MKSTTRSCRTTQKPSSAQIYKDENAGRPAFWMDLEKKTTEELAEYANEQHAAIGKLQSKILDHAHRVGTALCIVQSRLPHGEYQPWVKANCNISLSQARVYCRIAEHWDLIEPEIGDKINFLNEAERFLAKATGGAEPEHEFAEEESADDGDTDESNHPSPGSQRRQTYNPAEAQEYDRLTDLLIERGIVANASEAVLNGLRLQCNGLV